MIPEKDWKSGIFSSIFQVPNKKSKAIQGTQGFQNHWTPWNSMYGITYIASVVFVPTNLMRHQDS